MIGSGVEIGSRVFRLAEVKRTARGSHLDNWATVDVPEGTVLGGAIADPKTAVPLLQKLGPTSRRKRIHGALRVGLPEQQTFLKIITVPAVDPKELPDAVKFESGQHIPFAPDEVVLDWQTVDRNPAGGTRVLVGAAPRALVESTLAAFDAAGLPVERLEIESLAMTRSLLEPTTPRNGAARILVDLGEERTILVVFDRGTVPFTSTLPYSQAGITTALAAALGISPEDAEKAKRLFGLDPRKGKGIVRKTVLPMLDELLEGIRRTVRFYSESAADGRPIEVLLLTGGGSLLPGLPQHLASTLKLRTRTAQLPEAFRSLGPSFATAIGLALG